MKITKFVHSCLLVEMPDPINKTALFDPGVMSEQALNVETLQFLDDIFITHQHDDHLSLKLIKKLIGKFPDIRITAPPSVVEMLNRDDIAASSEAPTSVSLFISPHEEVYPLYNTPSGEPNEYGYHYLDLLSHPGDSHSFKETKPILALPVTAPWGTSVKAVQLALELKPKHIIPIHDWHWRDEAKLAAYENMEKVFSEHNITFHKLQTGQPVDINL